MSVPIRIAPQRDPSSMADHVEAVLEQLGEDPGREGLRDTPARVAAALEELTSGQRLTARDVIGDALFAEESTGAVLVRDIEFYSLCEHHMLPFHGVAHVAYLPAGHVVGLSKVARLVDVFARRLQVQERITRQVADALVELVRPRGVAVMLEAAHFCMMMRGVQKQGSRTITVEHRGAYADDARLQAEFLALARR